MENTYRTLTALWPDRQPQLSYSTCFELLVAVMLSAQCTDDQVNKVTPALFTTYPNLHSMAEADITELESLVRSTGFYHTKAANIIATSRMLKERFDGKVPENIDELVCLPGVGRKTANLVVSACFGKPGIVVDTHVLRIARRLGIAPTDDPARSERMIAASINPERWTAFSHALNRHGKFICTARKPKCQECVLKANCPSVDILTT
ncbi:MAG: endonuclease III [Spirochaetes bacterium RIFOXYC1_FULL_54_7]|nr:MAG: endonuclease III [Spirochaetes bacterium RIFOXYC1_FULL_54_7]